MFDGYYPFGIAFTSFWGLLFIGFVTAFARQKPELPDVARVDKEQPMLRVRWHTAREVFAGHRFGFTFSEPKEDEFLKALLTKQVRGLVASLAVLILRTVRYAPSVLHYDEDEPTAVTNLSDALGTSMGTSQATGD